MKVSIGLFCVVLLSLIHRNGAQCTIPKFFTNIGEYNDPEAESENCSTKTYYLSSLPLFWIEALLTCRSYSMNLLTIGSSAEYNYLKTVIQLNNTLFQSNTFVGLTRLNGNQWYWINEGNLFNVTTVNWWPGEPNGGGASECAALVQSGVQFGLNDLGCRADVFRFICEDIY